MASPSESLPYIEQIESELRRIFTIKRRFDLDVRQLITQKGIFKTFTPVYGLGQDEDGVARNRLRVMKYQDGKRAVAWSVQMWSGQHSSRSYTDYLHPHLGILRGVDRFKAIGLTTEDAAELLTTLKNARFGGTQPDPFKR